MALLPIALLSILGLSWWMGWGVLRVLIVIVIVWIAVLAFMLAAPASEIRAAIGFDPQLWLAGGILLGLITAYFAVVRRLKAEAQRRWGTEDAPRFAALPSVPADGPVPKASVEGWKRNEEQALDRYARHIVLREIGGPGQAKLRNARVLLIGAGGLGAPAALYLAGAGVGRITIADPDTVSVSNLQRQIIYRTSDAGRPKGWPPPRRCAR